MFQVKINRSDRTECVSLSEPTRISDLIIHRGMHLDMPCGGKGKCLKCRVQASGSLSEYSDTERKALTEAERQAGIRLACMTFVTGDAEIRLQAEKTSKIMSGGHMPIFEKHPLGKSFGIAVDIGTTTVAAYLYNLQTCELAAYACADNPQRTFGADVISRIEQSLAGKSGALAKVISDCIEQLAVQMCEEQNIPLTAVDSMVITGNTTMLYLLTDTNTDCLSHAPFEASTLFGQFAEKSEFSLAKLADVRVYLPGCISAYVGADITTAILSSEISESETCSILVDIGTNGEMALRFGSGLWCCSTAAGPAFEGAGIHMGMNATEGAIDHVTYENGMIRFSTIGTAPAVGLCGSGIIDAVAVLLTAGVLDETGYIQEEGHPFEECICEVDGATAFRFPGSEVVLTQKDIRSVQLAKSAICAGLKTLMHQAELSPDNVERFYIAGGFGSYINTESAVKIGLFPSELKDKAIVLGNAAGMGASMILLSDEMLEKSRKIAAQAETIELSTSPYFSDAFIEGMLF